MWTGRYTCVLCKAIHIGDCAGATTVGDDERAKERRCVDCAKTKGVGAQKRQFGQDDNKEGGPSSPSKKRSPKKSRTDTAGATPGSPSALPRLPSSTGSESGLKVMRR